MIGALTTLAWQPFVQPMQLDDWWLWLMLPMVLGVAIVYKAIKLDDLRRLPAQALWLAAQIVGFMVIAAAVLWTLTELL